MSIHKLQQDILRCKHIISEISIKHYSNNQNTYIEIVNEIFQEIFPEIVTIDNFHDFRKYVRKYFRKYVRKSWKL